MHDQAPGYVSLAPTITPIPIYNDNYVWIIETGGDCWIVDPGLSEPVSAYIKQQGLQPKGIVITHNHWDHVTGIADLVEEFDIPVYGPNNPEIPHLKHPLTEGDTLAIAGITFSVMEVPGHTFDHIVYFATSTPKPILLCGDTIFGAGCGRLYTGTIEQFFASLQRISRLPSKTQLYCTHEYTEQNIRFALSLEPSNTELQDRETQVSELRKKDLPTLPSNIGIEIQTNPFLRCHIPEVIASVAHSIDSQITTPLSCFTEMRALKDHFR